MVFTLSIDSITTTTTLSLSDDTYIVDASGGSFTITLPQVITDGIHYKLIRTDNTTNIVTVVGNIPAETIDGQTSTTIISESILEFSSFGIDDGTGGVWYTTNRPFNSNSTLPLSFRFDVPNGGPISTSSSTYVTVGSIIYKGTAIDGLIKNISIIVSTSNTAATGQLRLYDMTNVQVISESAIFGPTNGTQIILNLTTISNLPTTEAIFAVQLRRPAGGGGGSAELSTLEI